MIINDYKIKYLGDIISSSPKDKPLKVLDIGSGTSKDWIQILKRFPNIEYYGVEYRVQQIEKAKKNLDFHPNKEFIVGFGEDIEHKFENHFDITISLSVLEHVKYLKSFLKRSVVVTKRGGIIAHRYDLGHALHSPSKYERFKVLLCKYLPSIMPAKHFTTYPDLNKIKKELEDEGVILEPIIHSQLFCLKKIVNILKTQESANDIVRDILHLENEIFRELSKTNISSRELDKLFPTIIVKGIKSLS